MIRDAQYQELSARILRASAPNLAHAQDVAGACADGREAWERLAAREVIPPEWLEDPRRQFVTIGPDRSGSYRSGDAATTALPTMAAAVTLGADAEGVTTAEALAREIVAGLASWRVPQPERVRWWVASDIDDSSARSAGARGLKVSPVFTRSPVMRAYYALAVAEPRRPRRPALIDRAQVSAAAVAARCVLGLAEQLAADIEAERQWRIAVEDRWQYNRVEFARLSCPFRALLALWATGYALVSIEDDAVTLGARQL